MKAYGLGKLDKTQTIYNGPMKDATGVDPCEGCKHIGVDGFDSPPCVNCRITITVNATKYDDFDFEALMKVMREL